VSLGAMLFGIPDMPLAMVVVVHAGTLLATLLVVGRDVGQLGVETFRGVRRPREFLASDQGRIVSGVVVATIPTAIMGLALEDRVESWSHVPWIIGVFLLGSAVAVLSTLKRAPDARMLSLGAYFLIGVAQGLAVMPGLSRSGTTIAAGMLLGLSGPEAFRFSFLLSLPAVLGAVVLELAKPGALAALGMPALIAGTVALVVGYVALRVLRHIVVQGRLWAFALYLVPLGVGLIAWNFLS
jgi:undecaprenyl-diphosphatase